MKIGKLPETTLQKVIFEQLNHKRDEVLIGPGIGEDCAALQLENDEVMVMSTDPITGTSQDLGLLAVHITANDLVSSGAEPIGLMVTALLPPATKESELREIIKQLQKEASSLNMMVIGGHTEVTDVVKQPLLSITGVGKVKKDHLLSGKNAKPGQDIVVTKQVGLEGTGIIAREKEEELRARFPAGFIKEAKACMEEISVVPEGLIGRKFASVMHDVTEGGIYGALWEVAKASNVGLEVEIEKIPLRQHTIELCEYYDLNPYQLISSGSMLMVTDHGSGLIHELEKAGIEASLIGRITKGNEKLVYREGKPGNLEAPKQDELYKIYE
ncbi:MAG: AIR synthase family protein [Anaerostipes sp.]|nr:AIR synthase family protein [Anaerostipes sp.]